MSATLRINEPLGSRAATLPLDLGGAGAALVLPGVEGIAVSIAGEGQWLAHPAQGARSLLNGQPLRSAQPLAAGDVLTVGEAQVTVHPDAGLVDVVHLAGNATVAPLREAVLPGDEVEAGVREIIAAQPESGAAVRGTQRASRKAVWLAAGIAAALVVVVAGLLLRLVGVPVQVVPEGAAIRPSGIGWHSGARVFMPPGRRTLTISHPGYQTRKVTLDVSRRLATALPLEVQLDLLPGIVELDTGGVEAQVLVDGRPAGKAPGEISLPAGMHDLVILAPRHVDHVARLEVTGGGERQQVQVQLQPANGVLVLDTAPAGATVRIDGREYGPAPQRVELEAGLYRLTLSAPGRRVWNSDVAVIAGQTLDLGRIDLSLPQSVTLREVEERQAEAAEAADAAASGQAVASASAPLPPPPSRIESPLLGPLLLLPAGEYLQGSERREQGRRSNEVQRRVTLTRAFYLAATEVSNAQYRAFRAEHASGVALEKSIDLDPQAVTRVSWNDAVEFCNWLSVREGLPPAYERNAGRWQLVKPVNRGYRLPTEAEWEYAARYVDGQRWQRYAWGDTLPPPSGAANLSGGEVEAARPAADPQHAPMLPEYQDEHPVVAPVNSYGRSSHGFFGLGGNVSEWMHDVYVSLPEADAVSDPMGPDNDGPHAIRGANWRSATLSELRAAWRERGTAPAPTIGFRVARYAQDAS
ncbi:MAG: SUMF1/EgtB/PvdO family nonheme iron enzyme [Pseudomonadota bacterium]|nr:SUMF1/EgtB/PvdO family nonheme iron enzyme [Pseudomonadota bacterium]